MAPTPLQIKTRALQRLVKEEKLYQQELDEQQQLVDGLKADPNTDEYELKKQLEILQENDKMIPAIKAKVKEHAKLLEEFLKANSVNEDTEPATKLLAQLK